MFSKLSFLTPRGKAFFRWFFFFFFNDQRRVYYGNHDEASCAIARSRITVGLASRNFLSIFMYWRYTLFRFYLSTIFNTQKFAKTEESCQIVSKTLFILAVTINLFGSPWQINVTRAEKLEKSRMSLKDMTEVVPHASARESQSQTTTIEKLSGYKKTYRLLPFLHWIIPLNIYASDARGNPGGFE